MYTVSQNFTLLGIAYIPLARLFTASLSIREREGEREASPSSLPLCAGVLFSRDAIDAFNDRTKIQEKRGLWTVSSLANKLTNGKWVLQL